MPRWLLLALLVTLLGCDKSVPVGGSYRISAPFSPDGQNHTNTLFYNNQKICDAVYTYQYHDQILVFIGYVEESPGPQLFAVSGAGPRVMLSERLVTDPRAFVEPTISGVSQPGVNYYIENLTPTADGVRARFYVATDENTGEHIFETHDLTWAQITQLLVEAQSSASRHSARSGRYLLLPRETKSSHH